MMAMEQSNTTLHAAAAATAASADRTANAAAADLVMEDAAAAAPSSRVQQQQQQDGQRQQQQPVSGDGGSSPVGVVVVRDVTLEVCLFGDAPVRTQRKKKFVAVTTTAAFVNSTDAPTLPKEKSSNNNGTDDAAGDDDKPAKDDIITDHDDDDDDDSSNHSSASIVEELAPVSSKWSECATTTSSSYSSGSSNNNNNNTNDAVSVEQHQQQKQQPPHTINLQLLRKIVSAGRGGIDDDIDIDDDGDGEAVSGGGSHRAVAWRVLLGYLPAETGLWHGTLVAQRNLYSQLAAGLFCDTADVVEAACELVRGGGGGGSRRRHHQRQQRYLDGRQHLGTETTAQAAAAAAAVVTPPSHERRKLPTVVIPARVKQHWKQKSLDLNVLERLTRDLNALQMKDLVEPNTDDVLRDDDGGADDVATTGPGCDGEGGGDRDVANLNDFVESALLLDEIRKDVVRTHPDLSFFLEPYHNLGRRRYAALERILFVWSKYNKGVRYVQGMNEIVGILYYVLANDQNEEWAVWAEADTYWLFHALLAEMSDVFVAGLDDHDTGIQGRIHAMQALLARHDPEVKEHLDEIGVEVAFYAIRWWTTLLSREFLLPDTIRLWDSMFASTHKDNFLRYVCVIMVMTIRDKLLMGDFSACLKLLHAFPSTSIERLLESSRALWIYESQISVACHRGGLTLHQALTTIDSPPALIMAFGFPNGTPPVSRAEQLERATVNIEATVRSAAQEVLGRARGLYNWYSKDYSNKDANKERSNSGDALALGRTKEEDAGTNDEEDIYLKAILHA